MDTIRSGQFPPSVTLLVERRYLGQAQPLGLARALAARGVHVETVTAEDVAATVSHRPQRVAPRDGRAAVVVPRGRSAALLAALRMREAASQRVLHSASMIESVVDKVGVASRLARAGIATPRTWLGHPARLAQRSDLTFPLMLKPIHGDNAHGLLVVENRAQLRSVPWTEQVALAQEFRRGDGHDLKVYVAGNDAWAVRRPSPVDPDGRRREETPAGHAVALTPALRELSDRCRALFGLSLFGIDCVLDERNRPLVVDVNEFPNYRGIDVGARVDADGVDDVLARVVMGVGVSPRVPRPATPASVRRTS